MYTTPDAPGALLTAELTNNRRMIAILTLARSRDEKSYQQRIRPLRPNGGASTFHLRGISATPYVNPRACLSRFAFSFKHGRTLGKTTLNESGGPAPGGHLEGARGAWEK